MTSQVSATTYERFVCSFQDRAALGVYRIRLDNVELPPIPPNRLQNVTRLKKIFRDVQKCLRHNPQNYITAKVSQDVFEHRSLTIRSSDGVNELLLRAEDSVFCLHGSCRIQAAKLVLRGLAANHNLQDAFANQLPHPDGTIYVNLQKVYGTMAWPGLTDGAHISQPTRGDISVSCAAVTEAS
ncbi:hypothetical protein LTR67_002232 [Exophiala xenobiotica]